jgi:hypothetical protein
MYREIAKERYPFTGWFWKKKKRRDITNCPEHGCNLDDEVERERTVSRINGSGERTAADLAGTSHLLLCL